MRIALIIAALLAASAHAQDLRDRALQQQEQDLEQRRQQQERDRSVVEQQRPELQRPVEKKRNAKDCENARVNYQTSCGSPIAPKYRSPACRDAEIFIRQAC
jgi:hypothetical protein